MIIDLTDYGFNITSFSRPYQTLSANTNLLNGDLIIPLINGDLIIPNNPLQVDSYYFPGIGIYSYRYISIPVEAWLNEPSSPFKTMSDIDEYLALFDFDKLRIEGRCELDLSKFFNNREYKAELDIDEEMLLYIKMKFGITK